MLNVKKAKREALKLNNVYVDPTGKKKGKTQC